MADRYPHKPSATDLLHDLTRIFESGAGFCRTHPRIDGPVERVQGAVEEFKSSPDWDEKYEPSTELLEHSLGLAHGNLQRALDGISAYSINDHPRWPDLEALIRVAMAESRRQQVAIAQSEAS